LRAIDFPIFFINAKLGGFMAMAGAIAILFVLPWLDRSPVRSWRYKGWMSRTAIVMFAIAFVVLTYLGGQPVSFWNGVVAKIGTVIYLSFFLLMPFYTKWEKTKPVPERVPR
jgi:ubiquinol-cytochrome c reductase cytochrome b subunit